MALTPPYIPELIVDINGNPTSGGGGGTSSSVTVTSGFIAISNSPAVTVTSGSVSVSNFPATQPVSGTVAVTGAYQATQPVSIASSVGVTGTFWQTTQPVSGSVSVNNFPASQVVTLSSTSISNFPATQPVSLTSTTITGSVTIVGGSTANFTPTTGTLIVPTAVVSAGGQNSVVSMGSFPGQYFAPIDQSGHDLSGQFGASAVYGINARFLTPGGLTPWKLQGSQYALPVTIYDTSGNAQILGPSYGSLIASGAYTTLQTSPTQTNNSFIGVQVFLKITAVTGGSTGIKVNFSIVNPQSGGNANIGSSPLRTTVSTYLSQVYPASGATLAQALGYMWFCTVDPGADTGTYTYLLDYVYMPAL